MKKQIIDDMEIYSRFEPRQNWFQKNEVNIAVALLTFVVVGLAVVTIISSITLNNIQ
jgi:hypothetical protein